MMTTMAEDEGVFASGVHIMYFCFGRKLTVAQGGLAFDGAEFVWLLGSSSLSALKRGYTGGTCFCNVLGADVLDEELVDEGRVGVGCGGHFCWYGRGIFG